MIKYGGKKAKPTKTILPNLRFKKDREKEIERKVISTFLVEGKKIRQISNRLKDPNNKMSKEDKKRTLDYAVKEYNRIMRDVSPNWMYYLVKAKYMTMTTEDRDIRRYAVSDAANRRLGR